MKVTILSLMGMFRPSDFAPKASEEEGTRFVLSMDIVKWSADGLSIQIPHVDILKDSAPLLDPISALNEYIRRSKNYRSQYENDPLFITLCNHFRSLKSEDISCIINACIINAGLNTKIGSFKCFERQAQQLQSGHISTLITC